MDSDAINTDLSVYTRGRKKNAEGIIPIFQQRVPASIFAQEVGNSSPTTCKSFRPLLFTFNYPLPIASVRE